MPPSSRLQPISRSAHLPGDDLAGRGRAGEADVVGALDDVGADLAARAGDHLPEVLGEAGVAQQLEAVERAQHGLGVGLGHDRVAGHDRRQPVAQRHREGVVPRRDDADDALGDAVHLDAGQAGDDAGDAARVQVLVRRARVVAGGQRDVQRLVEGVLARLARLPADEVDDLVLALQHEVVQPQHERRPLLQRGLRPGRLRASGALEGRGHVGGGRLRDVAERLSVHRGDGALALAAGRVQQPGQAAHQALVQGVRRARVGLGVEQVGRRRVRRIHIPRVSERRADRNPPVTSSRAGWVTSPAQVARRMRIGPLAVDGSTTRPAG